MIKQIIIILCLLIPGQFLWAKEKFKYNEYKAEKNFRTAYSYYNDAKYLSAIEYFIKSLSYNPDYSDSKLWLGKAYYKAGYIDNALQEWEEAAKEGLADNTITERLNYHYFQTGKTDEANLIRPYVYLKTIDGNSWDSKRFIQPISILGNYDNEFFITGLASKTIVRLDANYNLINKISRGKESFSMPYGFALDTHGDILISDVKKDLVQKLTKQGKLLLTFGGQGTTEGKFLGPEGICVTKDNCILVADSGNCRIQKFSSQGEFLMEFGSRGDEPGQFLRPTSVTVDDNNNIYVSDYINKNIQKFDEDGNFIEELFSDKQFSALRNIHYKNNCFFIADGLKGAYIYNFNDNNWIHIKNFNFSKNKILFASDIYQHTDGTLYISDLQKNTVELFVPEQQKYANLHLEIENIDITQYPRVVIYASVFQRNGKPLAGLIKKNFTIREIGVRIAPYEMLDNYYDKKKIKSIFLVEKSDQMKKYENEIITAASFFMKDILKRKDEIKVENFHKAKWTGQKYDFSQLRINAALQEDNYNYLTDISRPLYESISELMTKLSRKALVFFTTGEYDLELNFKAYSLEVIKQYARVNHVPVFIINFTQKNEKELRDLAKTSGGKYYYYFKDARYLRNIQGDVLNIPINQYIFVYDTLKDPHLIDLWKQVDLSVEYNKLSGSDRSGYFVPDL